jgi:hypothetical protein
VFLLAEHISIEQQLSCIVSAVTQASLHPPTLNSGNKLAITFYNPCIHGIKDLGVLNVKNTSINKKQGLIIQSFQFIDDKKDIVFNFKKISDHEVRPNLNTISSFTRYFGVLNKQSTIFSNVNEDKLETNPYILDIMSELSRNEVNVCSLDKNLNIIANDAFGGVIYYSYIFSDIENKPVWQDSCDY